MVSITCGMDDIGIIGIEDESGMLVWPASAKVDVMAKDTKHMEWNTLVLLKDPGPYAGWVRRV